jgi:hypothetical protein
LALVIAQSTQIWTAIIQPLDFFTSLD